MSNTKPRHPPQIHFPIIDGMLQVAGIPLTRLAQRVGRTPFFAYDRALCTARAGELRAQLPAAVARHYSVKAKPMPAPVQHKRGLGGGVGGAAGGAAGRGGAAGGGDVTRQLDRDRARRHAGFERAGRFNGARGGMNRSFGGGRVGGGADVGDIGAGRRAAGGRAAADATRNRRRCTPRRAVRAVHGE